MSLASKTFLSALMYIGILYARPVIAETLTQAQIASQIIGKDLKAKRKGMAVRLRYNFDGSVVVKAAFISGAGTWAYSGDGLCMTMTAGPRRGKTCTTFEALGNGTYRNSEGLILRVNG